MAQEGSSEWLSWDQFVSWPQTPLFGRWNCDDDKDTPRPGYAPPQCLPCILVVTHSYGYYPFIMITIVNDVPIRSREAQATLNKGKQKYSLPHSILLSPALLGDATHGEHGLGVQHGEVRQEVLGESQSLTQDFMVGVGFWGVFEQILREVNS